MIGTLCLVYAVVAMSHQLDKGPSVAWHPYSDPLLAQAVKQKKPVIIDFYADWCSPCRELDDFTFHHSEIVKRSIEDFIMIKVDITSQADDQKQKHLLNRYNIKGVPTVVFLDADGIERKELRLVAFEKPEAFLNRMNALQ